MNINQLNAPLQLPQKWLWVGKATINYRFWLKAVTGISGSCGSEVTKVASPEPQSSSTSS